MRSAAISTGAPPEDGKGVNVNPFGRFSVIVGSHEVNLGALRQRAILALLTTRMNQAVSLETITDAIWGQSPPFRVKSSIQAYISRLRKLMAIDTSDSTQGKPSLEYCSIGYSLIIDPLQNNAYRFETQVGEGRKMLSLGHFDKGAKEFENALEICDGVPYGDLFQYDFAIQESARLEDLRLTAVEGAAKCRLELRDYRSVTDSLGPDVRRYPFREDLAGYYMIALNHSGRRAEALRIYERTQSHLSEELGVHVGKDLRNVYHTILS
jgi:DNA-binding SARP family transcriptional activator